MVDSLRHVDVMIKEIRKDLAADPPTDSSGGACAALCGHTESVASIVDIGDITLKQLRTTFCYVLREMKDVTHPISTASTVQLSPVGAVGGQS